MVAARFSAAANAARDAWRTFGSEGEAAQTLTSARRKERFMFLYALYAGDGYRKGDYKSFHQLYNETRQVANPVKALCDFYATHVYAGPVAPNGEKDVEGEDSALPIVVISAANEAKIRAAVGQLSHGWWGWDVFLNHRVRQTQVLGSLLTEIIDDPSTGKIELDMVWPGVVEEVTLDGAGNVKGYVLEYWVQEREPRNIQTGMVGPVKKQYRYRKVVTGDGVFEYRNNELYDETPNVYGFVPATWDRARLGWSAWGEPAIHGSMAAVDEMNELWSHADDRLHQMFSAPIVVAGAGGFQESTFNAATRAAMNTFSVPGGGGVSTIEFSLGEVLTSIERIMDAITVECPELKVYDEIRKMSTVTGPGIRRAVADVEHRLNEAAAISDRQTVKQLQMGMAIGGMRLQEGLGGWAAPNAHQQKFDGFDLDTFKHGDMDLMLLPRVLVKTSPTEKVDALVKIQTLDDEWLLEQAGVPQSEVQRMLTERRQQDAAKQQHQLAVAQAGASQGGGSDAGKGPGAPGGRLSGNA